MSIPRNKKYPEDSVQCRTCGGHGCPKCDYRGWFTPATHPEGRKCHRKGCESPIPPNYEPVENAYCTDTCYFLDAEGDPPTPEQVKAIAQKYGWTEEVTLEKILHAQRDVLHVSTVQDAVVFLMEALPPRRAHD